MAIIALNGSPRKGWNTHLLLEKALEGARSKGAETELINLYDLNFKGCLSCFECKRKNGPSVGVCAVLDDLRPALQKIAVCDALILGSPIYIGEVTASMRALVERLTFQYIPYSKERTTFFEGNIPSAFIYTMNVPESALEELGYTEKFEFYGKLLSRVLNAPSESLISTETWQTEDYGKYHMSMFDEAERRKRRSEVFPQDLEKAFALGAALVQC
ncbi:flavodoxin [Synergistales bacterium]|nr:flavodoxin [Synergistales bacterium]